MGHLSRWVCLIALLLAAGCGGTRPRGSAVPAGAEPAPRRAEAVYQQALLALEAEPAAAERLLCQALAADPQHGLAHLALGRLLLDRGELYPAAVLLDRAARLLPGHPEARILLGIVQEKVAHE